MNPSKPLTLLISSGFTSQSLSLQLYWDRESMTWQRHVAVPSNKSLFNRPWHQESHWGWEQICWLRSPELSTKQEWNTGFARWSISGEGLGAQSWQPTQALQVSDLRHASSLLWIPLLPVHKIMAIYYLWGRLRNILMEYKALLLCCIWNTLLLLGAILQLMSFSINVAMGAEAAQSWESPGILCMHSYREKGQLKTVTP